MTLKKTKGTKVRKASTSGRDCLENGVFTGVTGHPTPRWIDLKSIDDVRIEMARIFREMRIGELDTQSGTRLVYVLSQIGRLIQAHDLEGKVVALEAVLRGRAALQCTAASIAD